MTRTEYLEAVLKAVEFVADGYGGEHRCPYCGALDGEGHTPDCKIAEALYPRVGDEYDDGKRYVATMGESVGKVLRVFNLIMDMHPLDHLAEMQTGTQRAGITSKTYSLISFAEIPVEVYEKFMERGGL